MSALVDKVDQERSSCWTDRYVIHHSEGYRVESEEGQLGYVEEVVRAQDGSGPLALRVRTHVGERGLVTVMIEDVLDVRAEGELILVRVA